MTDIPRSIERRLTKRGAKNRILAELLARTRILEQPNIVYSTQVAETQRTQVNKHRGEILASDQIRARSSTKSTGRTDLSTIAGRTCSSQGPRMRVIGEFNRKK